MRGEHAENRLENLLRDLAGEDDVLRRHAAEDLGDLGDEAAAPALIRALGDPVVAVREAAAEALVLIGGREACRRAAALMASEDAALRNLALEILERLGPEAVDELLQGCLSPSSDIRKFAIDVLGKIGEASEIKVTGLLVAMLDDVNVNVAGAAAEAIGRVGDQTALPALLARLDSEPWLQCCILHAMARLGGAAAEALATVDVGRLSPEALHYHRLATDRSGRK